MEMPGDPDEIRLVAILRTLKKTQDEVAEILRIRKERVVGTENWLRTAPLEDVEGVMEDYRLNKVVEDRLSVITEVQPKDIVRAARVNTDDILQHYRTDYWQSSGKEFSKHLDAVKQTAQVWYRLLERLHDFTGDPILKVVEGIATSIIAWSKWTGKPILGGIEPGTEWKYEKQDTVDLSLSDSLWAHYKDGFGKLPFSSWKKLTVQDISPSLINNMRTIAYGRSLKFSTSCAICKAIIRA